MPTISMFYGIAIRMQVSMLMKDIYIKAVAPFGIRVRFNDGAAGEVQRGVANAAE